MARTDFVLFLVLATLSCRSIRRSQAHKDHVVGGAFGWKTPPNASFYQEWVATNTFVVGDKLVFMYRTSAENIWEVSSGDYEKCGNEKVKEMYYMGPTIVELSTPGPHFFYSGIGLHCEAGQKLAVNVTTTAPPPPFVADDSLYSLSSLKDTAAEPPSKSSAQSLSFYAAAAALICGCIGLLL